MRGLWWVVALGGLSGCGWWSAWLAQQGAPGGAPASPGSPSAPGTQAPVDTAAPVDTDGGAAPVDTAAPPAAVGIGPTTPGRRVITDCATSAGYQVDTWLGAAPAPGDPAVWVGAVYETHGNHSGNNHPMGQATVRFDLPGRNVLVLSSYEPVTWNLSLGPSAALERILVYGCHRQVVVGAAGVPVSTFRRPACGYSWPYNGGGCDTAQLWRAISAEVGAPITRHDGCYQASALAWGQVSPWAMG